MCDIIHKHMHSAHMHIQHYKGRAAYRGRILRNSKREMTCACVRDVAHFVTNVKPDQRRRRGEQAAGIRNGLYLNNAISEIM